MNENKMLPYKPRTDPKIRMEKKRCKVSVVIRLRPPLKKEDKSCVSCSKNSVYIFNHRNVNENLQYDFASVYDTSATQQQIFQECIKPKILHLLEGQNVSIFAYGPTGAGKTHTMLGSAQDPGMIPRVITGIFQKIEEQKKNQMTNGDRWDYTVSFSYLEIYNEKVIDLLNPKSHDLPIREDANKNIFVPGLGEKEIHSFDEFKNHFGPASNNRTVAATKLNDRSSRSHSILQLNIKKSQQCAPYRTLHGKIYLIDLAGSEDNRRTGNKGIRLKESGAINKSLFVLGEVVDAINSSLPRVPYRNSKLTRLLQDSIGGSCHSVMITNVAPEERYYYDTYCTLNFASKSKKIVNNTCIRETVQLVKHMTPTCPEEGGASAAKRPKMSAKVPDLPPPVMDPAPFLSPLLRRQNRLEETVNKRLEDLERNILSQMKDISQRPNSETTDNAMLSHIHEQLEASRQQLISLTRHTPNAKCKLALADKTNCMDDNTPKPIQINKLKRQKSESDMSCSPLFAKQPRLLKKKGFRSTAKPKSDMEPVCEEPALNQELQGQVNEEFMKKINQSSVKELQCLQTVGVKRAKLIFEWREAYGEFSNYQDLKKIPGFTDKYISSLLKSNLVSVSP